MPHTKVVHLYRVVVKWGMNRIGLYPIMKAGGMCYPHQLFSLSRRNSISQFFSPNIQSARERNLRKRPVTYLTLMVTFHSFELSRGWLCIGVFYKLFLKYRFRGNRSTFFRIHRKSTIAHRNSLIPADYS
jgi:hypothetical protein